MGRGRGSRRADGWPWGSHWSCAAGWRLWPWRTQRRPNILFILADDLGWRDLSCEGSTYYESLVALLKGGAIADRPLYWHYPHYGNQGGEPSSIITEGDSKLIRYHEDEREELYHLATDPGEQTDVASLEPDRVRQLRAKLDAWLQTTNARFPMKDPQFDLARRAMRWHSLATEGKAGLEKRHTSYLKAKFRPHADRWGSTPND